jgi:hypothetical protein
MKEPTVNVRWTAHLANKDKDKADFVQSLMHSNEVLTRLKQIIEENQTSLDKIEFQLSSYDDVNWSAKQAHINGRRAAYEEIKQLL